MSVFCKGKDSLRSPPEKSGDNINRANNEWLWGRSNNIVHKIIKNKSLAVTYKPWSQPAGTVKDLGKSTNVSLRDSRSFFCKCKGFNRSRQGNLDTILIEQINEWLWGWGNNFVHKIVKNMSSAVTHKLRSQPAGTVKDPFWLIGKTVLKHKEFPYLKVCREELLWKANC